MGELAYEHITLEMNGKKSWIRRSIDQEEKAEIFTDDATIMKCLTEIAKTNPEVITVLTEEGEEHFHCIVGKELSVHLDPCSGSLEFWIEKEHMDELKSYNDEEQPEE